jgi:hypothetical protein
MRLEAGTNARWDDDALASKDSAATVVGHNHTIQFERLVLLTGPRCWRLRDPEGQSNKYTLGTKSRSVC